MVALSDVVAAERLTLGAELIDVIQSERAKLRASGSTSMATWHRQHNVQGHVGMKGGGGVRTFNSAVPVAKENRNNKTASPRPVAAPPSQMQFVARKTPPAESYDAGKYLQTEGQ
jgi:hypothetical protein